MEQEQMNTPNSTNNVDMNIFKSLVHLLSNSYKNHSIKFWINVSLLILSIGTLVIIRTDNGFIPSLFSYETNRLINLCIDYVFASYIIGLYLYIFWKASPIKKEIALSSIITFLILGSIIIALWLIPVYNVLQHSIIPEMKLTLGEFGSFFASITGLLAFLAVLYTSGNADKRAKETIALAKEEAENNRARAEKAEENNRSQIEEARNRYKEDSERTIFFQLLDLHTKKVDSVICNFSHNQEDKTYNQEYKASQAFKQFTNKANLYLNAYITYKKIESIKEDEINPKMRRLFLSLYSFLQQCTPVIEPVIFNMYIPDGPKLISDVKSLLQLEKLKKYHFDEDYDTSCITYFLKKKDFRFIYDSFKYSADIMYKEYGHILGHYFRNMYYVMDTINNFSDKKNYKELFRAQLSRYELSLGFFNAVSSRSSIKMVELLEEFDIFKDLYEEDITVLKLAKEEGIEPSVLINNILNEYKKDINKLSDN